MSCTYKAKKNLISTKPSYYSIVMSGYFIFIVIEALGYYNDEVEFTMYSYHQWCAKNGSPY